MIQEVWTTGVSHDGKVYIETGIDNNNIKLYVEGKFSSHESLIRFASNLARKINGTLQE